MDKLIVRGGSQIFGDISISGAKNAVLPMMAATIIEPGIYNIKNVPNLKDTRTMIELLEIIGAKIDFSNSELIIDSRSCNNPVAPYNLVKTMRASFYVLGPLLSRFKKAEVSLPGGCAWGPRPVDFHLKALEKMGGKVCLDYGNILIEGSLTGANIQFEKISVGATGNVIMAAVKAEGETVIRNASVEPEIINLVEFLNNLGAEIEAFPNDNKYIIKGVKKLSSSTTCSVIPDRIEAGTYIIATALLGGEVTIKRVNPDHLKIVIGKIIESGSEVIVKKDCLTIKSSRVIRPVDIETSEYPGFPTDLQAQWMALMTQSSGRSKVLENIYHDRFAHIPELRRFGADIRLDENTAFINGKIGLKSAPVMSTDIRASASLVLAALRAEGESEISRIYHLDRGYEDIVSKFTQLGANIERTA